MKWAYYNDIDPIACAVVREAIRAGIICDGEVDGRSIKEVDPDDIRGFAQTHFFCGAGLWSIAARIARWPDDRRLVTASCPCQPFSVAGKGAGRDDPRHLWPDFFRLARAVRPPVIVGEQVAGSAGFDWFDGVASDLESEGYACRAVDIPACAVDAPHRRQRLYWVAVADATGDGRKQGVKPAAPLGYGRVAATEDGLADADRRRHSQGLPSAEMGEKRGSAGLPHGARSMADADSCGRDRRAQDPIGFAERRDVVERADGGLGDAAGAGLQRRTDAERVEGGSAWRADAERTDRRNCGSFWSDAGWLDCADGKARRAESRIRLLVNGLVGRADLWRLAGNSIVPQLAAEVLSALAETLDASDAVRIA